MSDEPVSKKVKTPTVLVVPQSYELGFTMDFNTFVQDGYEVFVEGGGPQHWSKRRLDVVARWKAMGVTAESVLKYALEDTAFSGDYSSLIKVVSAYELYASVKFTAIEGTLNFVQDSQADGGGGGGWREVTRVFGDVKGEVESKLKEELAIAYPEAEVSITLTGKTDFALAREGAQTMHALLGARVAVTGHPDGHRR